MEKHKNTGDILLARYKRKSFLYHIFIENEKCIYFENPKRKNMGSPGRTIYIDRIDRFKPFPVR